VARPVRRGIRVMDMRRKCSRREEAPRLVRDAGRVQEHIRRPVDDRLACRGRPGGGSTNQPYSDIEVIWNSHPVGITLTTPPEATRGPYAPPSG